VAHKKRKKIPSARGLAIGSKDAYGIGRGGLGAQAFLAWGVWKTLENAAKIFQ
jgi:hypothetical protein